MAGAYSCDFVLSGTKISLSNFWSDMITCKYIYMYMYARICIINTMQIHVVKHYIPGHGLRISSFPAVQEHSLES